MSFILRFCAGNGAGERRGGGTVRFVFYKAALGCWVNVDQKPARVEVGALGYQDRGLEWGKRVGVSRVEVHDGGGWERIQEEA